MHREFLWEVIALLLPSRRKSTDADSRRARENSVLLSIQADVAAVALLRGTRRQGGESVPEPFRAEIRAEASGFKKTSVQGSSAVR